MQYADIDINYAEKSFKKWAIGVHVIKPFSSITY
jgi:hypothetical protein